MLKIVLALFDDVSDPEDSGLSCTIDHVVVIVDLALKPDIIVAKSSPAKNRESTNLKVTSTNKSKRTTQRFNVR